MQSSVLTKPDVAATDTLDRRRPGRFDDVSPELVSLLRGDVFAQAERMDPEDLSVLAHDPVAERQTAFKVVVIIVALVGLVMLFGR